MAVAFLFAGLALLKASRLERALRWILVGGFVAVAVLFVVLSVVYGMDFILYARSVQPPSA
jgi:hypothetical protein